MRRVALVTLALLACGAGGWYFFRTYTEGAAAQTGPAAPRAVPVVTAPATLKPLPRRITAVGRVQVVASVAVKTRIDGEIAKVAITDGQEVKAGDLLFQLDPRQAQAALAQAQANLARDRANLTNAERQVARLKPLGERDYVTKVTLDTASTSALTAEAQMRATEAQIESLKIQLSYLTIRSSIDGRAGTITLKAGNSIKANDTAPLVTINQMKPIYVSFAVPQADITELRHAMESGPVTVTASAPNTPDIRDVETGTIAFLENAIDPLTNTISVKASFPNSATRLWPGQYVNVVVTLGTQANALAVPNEAIQSGQTGPFVYLVRPDMTIETRPVAVDRMIGKETVVGRGLAAGDKVVIDGQLRVTEGTKVQLRTATPPPASAQAAGEQS
jgi:multidrug efflux system membrane fusion protein